LVVLLKQASQVNSLDFFIRFLINLCLYCLFFSKFIILFIISFSFLEIKQKSLTSLGILASLKIKGIVLHLAASIMGKPKPSYSEGK